MRTLTQAEATAATGCTPMVYEVVLRGGPLDGIQVSVEEFTGHTVFFGIPDLDDPGRYCWYPYQQRSDGSYQWGETAGGRQP